MPKGIAVSKGYGIGNAVIIKQTENNCESRAFTCVEAETSRLDAAVEKFCDKTAELAKRLQKTAGEKEAEILQGHLAMLNDPFMLSQMKENINGGSTAEKSVETVCNMFIEMFSAVDDEMTKQRATDVADIKNSLIGILCGGEQTNIAAVPKGSVLIAKDFTPSMTSQIDPERVCAVIAEIGGYTSHSAILARAMGIPAVLSLKAATGIIKDGDRIIVDGFDGTVIINPDENTCNEYAEKQDKYKKEKQLVLQYAHKKAVTASGIEKAVYANIGSADEATTAVKNGAEGIGLFRTEFLFMDKPTLPSLDEQYKAYSTVAKALNGSEVIIRALDIGGDKAIDTLKIEKEDNPFLGHRGIRYLLDNPEIFKTQIKAVLMAAKHGDVKLMLPMVTTLQEIQSAKEIIAECKKELKKDGLEYSDAPLGIMIETPSAALISDILAKEVAFFSIGTNDLTGYTMAVDRGNSAVSRLYDPMQPAVLKAIEMTVKNAKNVGIPVGMCGEAAADERIIPLLVKWGLDEFSVTQTAVAQTKKLICECE